MLSSTLFSVLLALTGSFYPIIVSANNDKGSSKVIHTKVLILGGGLTGITAARTLALEQKVDDFLVVEARDILGGRMRQGEIGGLKVEFGANWVQGLGSNPIWALTQKYGVKNQYSDWTSIDYFTGDGHDDEGLIEEALVRYEEKAYPKASEHAQIRERRGLPDLNMKAGLNLAGWKAQTPEEKAVEYFSFDWEQAEPPVMSSYIQSINSYNENFIGFGNGDNQLVIDQRGFKEIIVGQAREIPDFDKKVLYNQVVENIKYSETNVTVTTKAGYTIVAEYALCTFSIGVLQHDDVKFTPPLPDWKKEAIANFHLATYTKLFAQFDRKFWNDTEFTVYADPDERGWYTVWQSLDAPGFFPGSKIFFGTLTSDQAYQAELQSDEETKKQFMDVLRTMYGPDIPDPINFTYPRWTLDPLYRGSFTNWGAGATVKQQDDIRAPLPGNTDDGNTGKRLFFAGEGTSRRYFGYLQGAYFEGRLAAHYLADCVHQDCTPSESTLFAKRAAFEGEENTDEVKYKLRRRRRFPTA
ncbi:hypothetical protein FRC03_005018 [Tulasnella sp. 419]|nr:hypothetical protein FRC03_005018 [Tulasnella sp. 419]